MSSTIQSVILEYGKPDLVKQILGVSEVNSNIVEVYDDYNNIYKIRHDLIHAAVCDKLNIPFGEKAVEEVLQSDKKFVATHQYFNEIRRQTPDYLGVKDDLVQIVEVTVSTDLRAKDRKAAKYALLCKVLQDAGYKLDYKILVFDPRDIYLNRNELIRMGLDDLVLDFASKICQNTSSLLRSVHRTLLGQTFYHTYFELSDSPSSVKISSDDVLNTNLETFSKCFHSDSDLEDILRKPTSPVITESDNVFLRKLLNLCKKTQNEITKKEDFSDKEFLKSMKDQSNTTERKSILPLPYMSAKVIDSSIRDTRDDHLKVGMIAAKMCDSTNSVINTIGRFCSQHMTSLEKKNFITNEDFLFVCKLSQDEDRINAIEGPNRKKYIRLGSAAHIAKQQSKRGYALDPNVDVSDIEKISFLFSHREQINNTGTIEDDMTLLSNWRNIGMNYVLLCQTVFREININSMRGDRRHKYIIKPTGAAGVYILLYPGTKLRCGELTNIVWFKLIVDNDFEDPDVCLTGGWIFKKLIRDNMISYTNWLSCDVHRLDHYIRSYDKILMAYSSIISQRYKNLSNYTDEPQDATNPFDQSLVSMINQDETNTLGLIILTYMEDKRTTSKMLQNTRYLIMTSISIYPKYKSVMEKFGEAIRSPLQLYYLQRCLVYIRLMKKWKVDDSVRFGSVKYDYKTHMFLDAFGGALVKLPRPLSTGPDLYCDFSEILSEMYFTMLFNKNQDDPTHASFQILDKIIEGEDKFKEVKKLGNHLGYRKDMSDEDFAEFLVTSPSTHQFSSRSIEVGSKLLREFLDDPFADQILLSAQKSNLNKTLDEFATFKSSSTLESGKYNPTKNRQNPRVRCIEAVNELIKEGHTKSFEIAEAYKKENTYYHVFKKNQIGGVREILILPMTVRIRINIIETLSRNICTFDRREVLTHGVTKNESIKSVLYTSKKYEGVRAPIHMTFDKSKWGPSFVPIQFLYLFTPFKKQLGSLFYLITDVLIRHQNKFCVLPDRLVKAWNFDPDNHYQHNFEGLQTLKEKFLRDKSLIYHNESNMGQGILHYTSSLLHLCMITLRDKLYSMWCKERNLDSKDHEDLLSSDDSYTIFCPELIRGKSSKLVKMKLDMFLRCQQVAEYLFNCRTSKVKSSINPLIGEFNSLFISNMTFIPTLFKYCLSSVHPLNTDSFYRMVKESYSSSRQIVENGGGLDLYLLSHNLNKRYCEEIYHTHPGGINDLRIYGLTHVPYHVGYYPIFNPALMLCFGPEYHNFWLYSKKWPDMNDDEKRMFRSSHKIIKGGLVETMAEFEEGDTILGGLLRIEAAMGPIKQLSRIRDNALMSRDDLSDMIMRNPLLIITRPKTKEEIIFKITHKLYTTGSKEALKNIAASIYYGRVSATVSANAFYIPGNEIVKKTYSECIQQMIATETQYQDLTHQIKFIYPKFVDYELFSKIDEHKVQLYFRNPLEIQTVQTLVTHKIYTKLTQPVPEILSYKWGVKPIPEHLSTKVERDFLLMKHHFPLIKDTIQETKDQLADDDLDQTKSLLLLMLKMYSLRDRNFKGVIHGVGSSDIMRTYETLIERNYSNSLSAELRQDATEIRHGKSFEKIYCAHNQTILLEFADSKVNSSMWEDISERDLIIFFQDPGVNRSIKKRVFMCAISNGFIKNAEDWSSKVGIILHYWHLKQKLDNGIYRGNFDITLYMGSHKLNCFYDHRKDKFKFQKQHVNDPIMLKEFFDELSGILEKPVKDMISKSDLGSWMVVDDKVLKTQGEGFEIKEMEQLTLTVLDNCKLNIDDNWTRLIDNAGYRIFNIETGLLACEYMVIDKFDFEVFGLKFSDMCKIGSFNQNFNVLYKSKSSTLDILTDMEVRRPEVSEITKRRLPFTSDWVTGKQENPEDDIAIEDTTDIIKQLMDQDLVAEDFKGVMQDPDVNESEKIDEIINFLLQTDVIYSMKTTQRVQHSRKIFLIIKNLKYDLICHHILTDMKISSGLIRAIKRLVKPEYRRFIEYSLVSLYDRIHTHEGAKSPEGLFLSIDKSFLRKFQVISDDESD